MDKALLSHGDLLRFHEFTSAFYLAGPRPLAPPYPDSTDLRQFDHDFIRRFIDSYTFHSLLHPLDDSWWLLRESPSSWLAYATIASWAKNTFKPSDFIDFQETALRHCARMSDARLFGLLGLPPNYRRQYRITDLEKVTKSIGTFFRYAVNTTRKAFSIGAVALYLLDQATLEQHYYILFLQMLAPLYLFPREHQIYYNGPSDQVNYVNMEVTDISDIIGRFALDVPRN